METEARPTQPKITPGRVHHQRPQNLARSGTDYKSPRFQRICLDLCCGARYQLGLRALCVFTAIKKKILRFLALGFGRAERFRRSFSMSEIPKKVSLAVKHG